jgi:hypothetical protein
MQERMEVLAHDPKLLRRALPAVGGLLLIVPGVFTVDALASQGSLSHATGLDMEVAYTPTAHLRTPTTVTISTMSVFGTKGHFSLRIGKKLRENFSITSITPQPLTADTDGNESVYTFTGGGKDAVQITLVPNVVGRTAATIQYGLDPPIPFSLTTVP